MSAKQLSAGDYIASRCSKCKDTTNHTIVAMVEGKVVRVQCNICNSVHNHRSPAEKNNNVTHQHWCQNQLQQKCQTNKS